MTYLVNEKCGPYWICHSESVKDIPWWINVVTFYLLMQWKNKSGKIENETFRAMSGIQNNYVEKLHCIYRAIVHQLNN